MVANFIGKDQIWFHRLLQKTVKQLNYSFLY